MGIKRKTRPEVLFAAAVAAMASVAAQADGQRTGTHIMERVLVPVAVAEHPAADEIAPLPADLDELPTVDENGERVEPAHDRARVDAKQGRR